MVVTTRSRIPEALFLVVEDEGGPRQRVYWYHSYQAAWNLKEKVGGVMYRLPTQAREAMNV
jgi:hypothetical protein